MTNHVEEIKSRLSIEEIVGSYIKLEKSGMNLKARCPFHNEKTPSFYVSGARGNYHCFGCGEQGDIFTFVQKIEGLDFRGALKFLAQKAGVELTTRDEGPSKDKTERLFELLEVATEYFEKQLQKNKDARDYILSRGLTEQTLTQMRIGYASNEWREGRAYLKSKGYSDDEMMTVGLIKRTDKATQDPFYDVFRGRIMFPIMDSSGRVVAFSGRIIIDDEKSPKYLNSPETILFKKSKILYGLDKAKFEIRKCDYSILVEGQMDLVMSHQAGFRNTVAVSGTAFSDDTHDGSGIGLVTRLSKNVIIAFDSDEAGYKATLRSAKLALALGMDVKVALIEGGKDPADIIKHDPKDWLATVKNALPIVLFLVSSIKKQTSDVKKVGLRVKDEVLPYVALYESAIEQSRLIELISGETGLKPDALWADLKKVPSVQNPQTNTSQREMVKDTQGRFENIESKLVAILLLQRSKGKPWTDYEKKVETMVGDSRFASYTSLPPLQVSALVTQVEKEYGDKEIKESEYEELLNYFEKEILKKQRDELLTRLRKAERDKSGGEAGELLKELQSISVKIHALDTKLQKK